MVHSSLLITDRSAVSEWEKKLAAEEALYAQRASIFAPMILDPWGNEEQALSEIQTEINSRMDLLDQLASETSLDSRVRAFSARIRRMEIDSSTPELRTIQARFENKTDPGDPLLIHASRTCTPRQCAEAFWPQACLAICRNHWLGSEEPLTPEQSASGLFEMEGDGARAFVLGLTQLGEFGPGLLRAFETHRSARIRARALAHVFEKSMESAEHLGLCPKFIDGSGGLKVSIEPRFDSTGLCHLHAGHTLRSGYFSGTQSMLLSEVDHLGIVSERDLGLLTDSDDILWNRFAHLCFSKASARWTSNRLAPSRSACERLLLSTATSGPSHSIAPSRMTPRV